MKRMASLLLCAALTVSTLTGCAGAPKKPYTPSGSGLTMEDDITPTLPPQEKPEQLLTLAYYPQRSLNPYESTDVTNRALFSLLYQGLFSVDRDYTVQPVLCKRYTVSDDMLTYVFYPEAAVFSDGSTLTAGDVAASLRAASQSTYYSGRFTHVDTIALTNGGGVSVTLNTPHENLPLLLDIPIVKQNQTGLDRPAGTGPYEFASGDGGLRLRKRADWWCEAELAIYADPITLIEAESNAHIRDQFEFADVGLVCTNPCTDTYADYRCDYELWDCENGVFLYLGCNMYSKVFSKPAVRSALTYAIDREKLASEYYRGFGRSATLPLSPEVPGTVKAWPRNTNTTKPASPRP